MSRRLTPYPRAGSGIAKRLTFNVGFTVSAEAFHAVQSRIQT